MFQIGDIVEILNITPDQAQYLDANLFIGMRYKVEKIWQPGELLSSDRDVKYVLAGFPENSIGYTTFFFEKQLRLYHRPEKVDFEDLLLLAKCDNNAILLYSQFENARKMYETGHDDYTEFLRKKQRVFEALIEWKHKKDLEPRQEK